MGGCITTRHDVNAHKTRVVWYAIGTEHECHTEILSCKEGLFEILCVSSSHDVFNTENAPSQIASTRSYFCTSTAVLARWVKDVAIGKRVDRLFKILHAVAIESVSPSGSGTNRGKG